MTASIALTVYRVATRLFEPGAGLFLRRRARQGKESTARLGERLGRAGRDRPDGPLAWVHAASVGEALAVLPLVEQLTGRGFRVLLTTGTVTSGKVLSGRLPAGALHQFTPLDLPGAVRRFYDHWQPQLICFVESELWPNLLLEAGRRGIPTALVNARMSGRSFARWKRMPRLIGPLLAGFGAILAQSEEDADRLRLLGAPAVSCPGNLKFDAAPPPAKSAELAALHHAIGNRPVWLAASTHAGEDLQCLAVHKQLMARWPDLLTIIVPRKVDRGSVIATEARRLGLPVRQRSRVPDIERATAVYIGDTMGEIGLFYRLTPVVFVGKSLAGGGGQNPIEPAKLGCAVIHGPRVSNFGAVYEALDAVGGSIAVEDEAALAIAVAALLEDAGTRERVIDAARGVVATLTGATVRTMAALEHFCAAALGARAA